MTARPFRSPATRAAGTRLEKKSSVSDQEALLKALKAIAKADRGQMTV